MPRKPQPFSTAARRHRINRRGMVLVYVTVTMTIFVAIISLAIDVAHVRVVKIELQQAADAAALYAGEGLAVSGAVCQANAIAAAGNNYADGTQVVLSASTDITYGTWNESTTTFTALSGWSSSATAVRITCRRTAASNNAVNLMFAQVLGISTMDVVATSTAYVVAAQSQTLTIPATSDPWLAGMPAGSTASYDDTTSNTTQTQVSIPIVPGSYISVSNTSGTVLHMAGTATDGPDGNTSEMWSHGIDSPGGPTPAVENGIGDIVAPMDAFLGLFLGPNAPNTQTAPTGRLDYTTSSSRDQSTYTGIQLQQPFFIGDGVTSGGTTQKFQVPVGATRLYFGTMDGYQWNNNIGSFSATINIPATVQLVQ
jgi:hypothetical protein